MEPPLPAGALTDSGSLNAWIFHDIEEPVKLHGTHAELLRPVMDIRLLFHVVPHSRAHGQQQVQDLMQFKTAISIPLLPRQQCESGLRRSVDLRILRVAYAPCEGVPLRPHISVLLDRARLACHVKERRILSCHNSSYLLSRSLTRSTSLWKPSLTTRMESGQTPPNASITVW